MGDIEMKTPDLLRTSFCIEDTEFDTDNNISYTPQKKLPGSAGASQRQKTAITLMDREFRNAKDDMRIISAKCSHIRQTMKKSVQNGASFLEQTRKDHPIDYNSMVCSKAQNGFG